MRLTALLLSALCVATAVSAGDLVLSSKGRASCVIVLPSAPIPSERRAARELASFLQQIGGATFRVQSDAAPLPPRAILLGNNAHLPRLGVNPDWASLGKEGFLLRTRGPYLIIAGGRPRGTMYGVYAFLEEKLGCRWYTSKISMIPRMDTVAVGELNETQVPALEYREPFNTDGFDPDWCSRNRCNSNAADLTSEHGGKISTVPFVHSFFELIPPAVHFKDHPDYFSMIDGKRSEGNTQLCLTNPDVVKLMVEKVKAVIRKHPDVSIVSVSQNDWGGYCRCPNCAAIDAAEGSPAGSLLTFVNAVAAEVEKEYPDIAIDTLAYTYTRKPPQTIRPRPNVIVRLCSIECDFGQPMATGPRNKSFADDVRGWHKLCDRLYIWDYVTSFHHYMVPFPNLDQLGPNVRFFVANGVKGIFAEGNYGPGGGGENNELRNYMLAKLLWNPQVDDDAVRRDFLGALYGPAAKPIEEYQRMLQKVTMERDVFVPYWFETDTPLFTDEIVAQSQALFDQAEAAVAGDQDLLFRVRQARMPIDYVVVCRNMGKAQGTWQLSETRFAPAAPPQVLLSSRRFFEMARAVGLRNLNEGGHGASVPQVQEFSDRVGLLLSGADVTWVKSGRFAAALTPDLGCSIAAVRDTETGADRLTFSAHSAASTGIAAFSETFFGGPSVNTRFVKDDQTGEYAADLPNGLRISRSVTPIPEGFRIAGKAINNGQEQPLQVTGRFLLALSGEVKITGAFGERTVPPIGPESTGVVALGPEEVAGQPVTFTSSAGASVTLAATGPVAGMRAGPGPDGLVDMAVSFAIPVLAGGGSAEWSYALTCSPQAGGAVAAAPGVIEAQDAAMPLYQEGILTSRRFDPTASDGSVGCIVGSTYEWALQWAYPVALFEPGRRYDVWAHLQVVANADQVDGVGLTGGVYSDLDRASRGGTSLSDQANRPGQWQMLKVATVTPERSEFVWFAPARNPGVKEIQVDRILMVPAW